MNNPTPQSRDNARAFDVVVAGAGTAGVVAALAAARQGARTALIESKGYPGGLVVEGGTALHSFYNLWKAFDGVAKRQVVKGIAQEIVDNLVSRGATSGRNAAKVGSAVSWITTGRGGFQRRSFDLLLSSHPRSLHVCVLAVGDFCPKTR